MVLKDLCELLRFSKDALKDDLIFSEFFHSIKDGYSKEIVEGFSSRDLDSLNTYSLCHVLAIYEYILNDLGIEDNGVLLKYDSISCSMEDNVVYKLFLEKMGSQMAVQMYNLGISESIEPFKSRGIIAKEFNYAV